MSINKFNVTIVMYPDFERYKIYDKPVLIPNNNGETGIRGHAKDPDKSINQSINRAKEKIFGYVMSNYWEYWATQTFNQIKLDRYNLDDIVRKYGQKLRNLKRRNYSNLQWLIIPEMHADGAWHLHMFISGIPKEKVIYSGYNYYNKQKRISRKIFNWVDTIDFGFNDYVYIGDIDKLELYKIALYITKYITKDLVKIRFNKKTFWCSQGLLNPVKINTYIDNVNYKDKIKLSGPILTESLYYLKDSLTGELYNQVTDVILYRPLPF